MYAEKLKAFENVENLGGKAWEHGVACDAISQTPVKDCSLHCFHYQQMFELFFKHLLETKSKFGAYPCTHKLSRLLEQLIEQTAFKTDFDKYDQALTGVTVCAEVYRYNFLIDCQTYRKEVEILDNLLDELVDFATHF
jgi:HEPN domain-containing protein